MTVGTAVGRIIKLCITTKYAKGMMTLKDCSDEHITIKAGAELGRQAKASLAHPVERMRQRDAGMEGFLNSKFSCKN